MRKEKKTREKIFFCFFFVHFHFSEKMQDQKMLNLDESEVKEEKVESLDVSEDFTIDLISKEENRFTLSRKAAYMSTLVKETLEDKEAQQVPLPNVSNQALELVVKYMKYHVDNPAKEIEKPLKSSDMTQVVSEYDANFVNLDQDLLFELILAANYMDIKPLLELTCAKVASMIKGKTPEQIRTTFNITNDFTPEEEESVRAESSWILEA